MVPTHRLIWVVIAITVVTAWGQMPPPLVRNPYTTNTPPNGWQALQFYLEAGQWISMSQSGQKWRISSTLTDPLTNGYTGDVRFLGSSNYFSGNVRIDGTLRLGGNLIGTNVVPLVALQASGTRDGTTYLRGDGVWASIPEGGSTEYIATLDPTKIVVQTNGTLYSIGVGPQVAITTNAITWTALQTFQQGAHTLGDLTGEQGGVVRWRISAGGVFTGNGSGLTNLNASELRSGTIDVARLPSSVALTNRAQTFYGDTVIRTNLTAIGTIGAATAVFTNNIIGNGAGITNIPISGLAATGTRDSTTVLWGNAEWRALPIYVFFGGGSPEGVVSASPPAIYYSTNGGFYVKISGSGATGWAALIGEN
jgi:hypothetical protein